MLRVLGQAPHRGGKTVWADLVDTEAPGWNILVRLRSYPIQPVREL